MSPRARVGVAVGTDVLTAVEARQSWRGARPARVWSWILPAPTDEGRGLALVAAFDELRDAFGTTAVSASIALLRPLGQAKVIGTPPLARGALEQLVQRNAARYFITGVDTTLASASPVEAATTRRLSTRAVAVCAAEHTVADIIDATAAADIAVERITAAPLALREAIRALVPSTRRGTVLSIVASTRWAEALLVDDDALRLSLPLPTIDIADAVATARTAARLIAEGDGCGARPAHALFLCDDAERAEGARQMLAGSDPTVSPVHVPPVVAGLSSDALAAFGAALTGGRTPSLATAALRDDRRRATLRRTAFIYVVAAMMLGVGAAAHLWSLQRRLDRVDARRRALAPLLAPVMAERRTIDAARSTLDALANVQRAAPRWTGSLATLARTLPDSAYLLSLSAHGSRLRLTGMATSARSVIAPLEASSAFSNVALAAATRRDGASRRERFELSLDVDPSRPITGAPPVVQPVRRTEQ